MNKLFENFPVIAELQNEQQILFHMDLYFEANGKMKRDLRDPKI